VGKFRTYLIHKLGGVPMDEVEKGKRIDRIAEAFSQRSTTVYPITLVSTASDPSKALPIEILYHDCAVKILQQAEQHIKFSEPTPCNLIKAELTILPIKKD
jgi:hypothetical protein